MNTINIGKLWKKLLATLIIVLLIMAVIIFSLDAAKIWNEFTKLSIYTLMSGAFFMLLLYSIRYLKWQLFLRSLGVRVGIISTMPIYMAGIGMGLTPGKVGEVIKSYVLEQEKGVSFSLTASTITAERLTGVLGCFILCVVALWHLGLANLFNYAVIVILAATILGMAIIKSKYMMRLVNHILANQYIVKYRDSLLRFYNATLKLLGVKVLLQGIAISTCYWFMECMIFYSLLSGAGIDITLTKSVAILTAASIGGAITMLPGSIGALEGGLVGILVYEGVILETATCVVLSHRVFAMWIPLFVGIFILIVRYRKLIFGR